MIPLINAEKVNPGKKTPPELKVTWERVFLYEFIQILISNVIFTTLWVYILSITSPHHMALTALLAVRVPKEIISWPIQAIVDLLILKAVSKTQIAK